MATEKHKRMATEKHKRMATEKHKRMATAKPTKGRLVRPHMPHLVVNNNVDGSPDSVLWNCRHMQGDIHSQGTPVGPHMPHLVVNGNVDGSPTVYSGSADITGVSYKTPVGRPMPHLVVNDNVDGSPDSVLGECRHIQGLIHDALPREGAVAMQQDAHVFAAVQVIAEVLLRPYLPQQYRIHGLSTTTPGYCIWGAGLFIFYFIYHSDRNYCYSS
jgi:hypothetical protein